MRLERWRYMLPLRLRSLVRGGEADGELDEELRYHIERQIEENLARGMSPAAARTAALRAFGGLEQRKEECRDARHVRLVEDLLADLRYALRRMRRAPGFTAVAVFSLALGIGANTAIFSLLDALVLKPLPVHDPDSLFALRRGSVHYPAYQAFRRHNQWFVDLFAAGGIETLDVEEGTGRPERTAVSLVSGSYFAVLGAHPLLGRAFTAADDQVPGAHPLAVASFGYWQRRFGGDPGVIGRTVRIGGTPMTIVGVMPAGFFGERVGDAPDLWVPLTMRSSLVPGRDLLRSPGTAWLGVVGRLKPGVTVSDAEAGLTLLFKQYLADMLGPNMADDDRRDLERAAVRMVSARNGVSRLRTEFSRPLQILMAVVALVLLIACANVATLLLVRAATRTREIGVRLALGMGRGRMIRQLLTESVLLSAIGGAAGLGLSWWLREVLLRLVSADGSRVPLAVRTDARLLLFVLLVSLATGILFGIAPAWQSARADLLSSLTALRHPGSGRRSRLALSPSLVVGQVALSLVLVVSAGLFLRTLANLREADLGFVAERLLIIDVDPKAAGYRGAEHAALCRRLLQRLGSVAGVLSATLSENGALGGRDSGTNRMRPERFAAGPDGIPGVRFDVVGSAYFSTMGIVRVAGRDFHERDDGRAPHVIAINETMARRFFADQDPIGQRMLWGSGKGEQALEVVAVVRDVRQEGAREEPQLRFYIPYLQHADRELASVRFIVRLAASADAMVEGLRDAVRSEDRRLSIASIDAATDLVIRTLARERMIAALSLAFGAAAMTLAAIGLYGLMAHRVVRRTSEIGVRMAFGAARSAVLWMILREDLVLVILGIAAGVPLALAGSRLTASVLYGISAADAGTLIASTAVIALAGLLAGFAPAWRAMRVDPATTLRHD